MKKKILIPILFVFSAILLCSCGKKEIEKPIIDELEIEDIVDTQSEKEDLSREKTEAGKRYEEQKESLNSYKYFYNASYKYCIEVKSASTDEEITAQFLVNTAVEQFSDKKVHVNSFDIPEPIDEGKYVKGEWVTSLVASDFVGHLDLDSTFQEILDSQVTPVDNWALVYCTVNSICKNLGCYSVIVTVDGEPLKTMYHDYEVDENIEYNCMLNNIYDDTEEMKRDVFISNTVNNGVYLTREKYYELINDINYEIVLNNELDEYESSLMQEEIIDEDPILETEVLLDEDGNVIENILEENETEKTDEQEINEESENNKEIVVIGE